MTTPKRIFMGLVIVTGLALLAVVAYRPLKFHYTIWRIESAATPAQERSAFILAGRIGRVWEVNKIYPNTFHLLPGRVKPGTNAVVTEIEWWESPWWDFAAQPYRAYRVIMDPKNLELLTANPK